MVFCIVLAAYPKLKIQGGVKLHTLPDWLSELRSLKKLHPTHKKYLSALILAIFGYIQVGYLIVLTSPSFIAILESKVCTVKKC